MKDWEHMLVMSPAGLQLISQDPESMQPERKCLQTQKAFLEQGDESALQS